MGVVIFIIAGVAIYFIAKQFGKSKLNVSDNHFEQHGVRVNFNEGTISINGHTYKVNQVTGIKITPGGGLSTKGVEIEVDDFHKPIHKITVAGLGKVQDVFAQRLSVALRKAGGPDFV